MARIPTIDSRDQLRPEHRPAYDGIVQSRGSVQGPFTVLLHSPEVAGRIAHLGAHIRFESPLPAKEKELAVLTVAREMDCRFEWAAHVIESRKAGVREEAIRAIRDRRAPQGLTAEEAQVVAYVQQVLRAHRVDDATFQALRDRIGVSLVVELTATIGYYTLLACTINAFELAPEPGADLLPV
jgi:4-carboxymuconolactone decarboxylase